MNRIQIITPRFQQFYLTKKYNNPFLIGKLGGWNCFHPLKRRNNKMDKQCFYRPKTNSIYYVETIEQEIEIIFDQNMNLNEKATIKRFKDELKKIKSMYELNPSKKEK